MQSICEVRFDCSSADDCGLHITANLMQFLSWVTVRSEEMKQYAFYVNLYGILIAF